MEIDKESKAYLQERFCFDSLVTRSFLALSVDHVIVKKIKIDRKTKERKKERKKGRKRKKNTIGVLGNTSTLLFWSLYGFFFVQYKPISVLEAKTRKNIQLYGPQRALWASKCQF